MNLKKTLKTVKLNESTISTILGAIVIVVVGVLVINYFKNLDSGEIMPPIDIESISLPTTHTVAEGEDLWNIAEKYYDSGYNWVDIANENKLANAGEIEVGQELSIPDVEPILVGDSFSEISDEVIIETPTEEPVQVIDIAQTDSIVHKVEKGETLWSISEKYYDSGYNWVDIANENELANAGEIEVGQELSIPSIGPSIVTVEVDTTENVVETSTDAISGATYEVCEGDNLWKIAVRAYSDGYKWTDIANENELENPNVIHPGNVLTLPR
ncbi:LysM peptidoglycan-binding domain-containing protein [Patescibacteria group bacterium]|nr:LysM peptidoglycan-binding domain-containing protein [Patescibacteria group bacterium]